MLVLFDMSKNQIHTFNNYTKLYNHIQSLERNKEKREWIFARYSYQRMLSFYQYMTLIFSQSSETKEGENLDILEMVRENVKKPVFLPIMPDVDVRSLLETWCHDYCKAHDYVLIDVSSPSDFKQLSGQGVA